MFSLHFIYTDSFLRGSRLDHGTTNGLKFPTLRDRNTLYNSTSCSLHAAGMPFYDLEVPIHAYHFPMIHAKTQCIYFRRERLAISKV